MTKIMNRKARSFVLIALYFLAVSCGEKEKIVPDPIPVTFRGELGGSSIEMVGGIHLFPDEELDIRGYTFTFLRERSATTLDMLDIEIPILKKDNNTYTVKKDEFSVYFYDSATLSGSNKGEWRSVDGVLQITVSSETIVKGKLSNVILENVDDANRTIRLSIAEFEAENSKL